MVGRGQELLLVALVASLIALAGARDQVGGWNDASRLATVEALVDHGTLAIDASIFATTKDKLFIDGKFYSDKSPVPALYLAGVYQVYQWLGGPPARDNKTAFVWLMTVASSGQAYVVAVIAILILGRVLGLPWNDRVLLTASFALATVAVVYSRQVNNHILFLGVAAPLVVVLAWLSREPENWVMLLTAGTLAGLGYAMDLGVGPVLMACTFGLIAYQCRNVKGPAWFVLGAVPWLALHHAVNYAVGGSWQPANANPEFFRWPGCPFSPANMTGGWNHESPLRFLTYAVQMLVGNRGFLGHNLPLFLAAAAPFLLKRDKPLLAWALSWSVLSWLMYAVTSNNYSGQCCAIRWFVPLLAPGYLLLGLLLKQRPEYRADFLFLSVWGAFLAGMMWLDGPWMPRMVPLYWAWQGLVLLGWLVLRGPWSGRMLQRWSQRARNPQAFRLTLRGFRAAD